LRKFQDTLARYNVSISALSCHGNPLHPDPERAKHDREVNRNTILLAEKHRVPVVIDFSGCPGDSPNSKAPNWVTCPWPPEYLDVLNWQWNEAVTPWICGWKWTAVVSKTEIRDHGVRGRSPDFLSDHYMSLQPGDIISTGTPPGVGMGQLPPIYLSAGNNVQLGIDGLGVQHQSVLAAPLVSNQETPTSGSANTEVRQ
jgi:hypothetical protein